MNKTDQIEEIKYDLLSEYKSLCDELEQTLKTAKNITKHFHTSLFGRFQLHLHQLAQVHAYETAIARINKIN